jgi:hypothetical protein
MIGNITLGGLTFVNVSNDADKSLFRETSRGATLPTEIVIRNVEITESKTKRPAHQTSVTVNRYEAATDGEIIPVVAAAFTVRTIQDAVVVSGDILNPVELIIALLTGTAADAAALDKRSAIFVTHDQ